MIEDQTLRSLSKMLYGRNYAVSLRRYVLPHLPRADISTYVPMALGSEAIVGGSNSITAQEMIDDIEASIRHQGDDAYGPKQEVLESQQFKDLLHKVICHFQEIAAKASRIEIFWLEEGHPDYPVFWDFAYLIDSPVGAEIFIGSSSD